ncbi:MAG: hypothetical protein AAF570_18990, partial [Bacteroidota bacterium]
KSIRQGIQASKKLFPGDYSISSSTAKTTISFELNAEGNLQALRYKDDGQTGEVEDVLHVHFGNLGTDALSLHGLTTEIDLSALSSHSWFITGAGNVSPKKVKPFNLLPGTYKGNLQAGKAAALATEFQVSNQDGVVRSQLLWENGPGNWEAYPPEEIWARAKGIAIYGIPGAGLKTIFSDQYARLHRKPSGAWHTLRNRTLYFQYTGEYDEGPLAFKLYNPEREDINQSLGLNVGLQKEHGDNRFAIAFPNAVPEGHYILEVTNEKNETFYLRFEIKP